MRAADQEGGREEHESEVRAGACTGTEYGVQPIHPSIHPFMNPFRCQGRLHPCGGGASSSLVGPSEVHRVGCRLADEMSLAVTKKLEPSEMTRAATVAVAVAESPPTPPSLPRSADTVAVSGLPGPGLRGRRRLQIGDAGGRYQRAARPMTRWGQMAVTGSAACELAIGCRVR